MLSCLVVFVRYAALVRLCFRCDAAAEIFCRGAGCLSSCYAVFDNFRAMSHRCMLQCGLSKRDSYLNENEKSVSERRDSRATAKVQGRLRVSRVKIVSGEKIPIRVLTSAMKRSRVR